MTILGYGLDLVEIHRIEAMLNEHGQRMLDRLFTPAEQEECVRDVRKVSRLAARFAAKEAAMKALGTGLADGIQWTDMSVVNDAHGAPRLVVTGRAAEIAKQKQITGWIISLTHTGKNAAASVLAVGA